MPLQQSGSPQGNRVQSWRRLGGAPAAERQGVSCTREARERPLAIEPRRVLLCQSRADDEITGAVGEPTTSQRNWRKHARFTSVFHTSLDGL
jgi:hypothetical protein